MRILIEKHHLIANTIYNFGFVVLTCLTLALTMSIDITEEWFSKEGILWILIKYKYLFYLVFLLFGTVFYCQFTHFFWQGEFLCPVCRQLANSVLPALPGDSQKGWKKLTISSAGSPDAAGSLTTLNDEINSLCIQQALSLLQSACNVVGKGEILKTIPMEGIGRIAPTIEPFLRMICRMYFPGKYDKVSGSTRVSQFIIMWDILKYSLISTEIASRCGRTSTTPTYCVDSLYKELNSSTGFILTLLLSIVQSMRNENPHHVLLRFRGIQLFAGSVCHGISVDEFPSTASTQGGGISFLSVPLSILLVSLLLSFKWYSWFIPLFIH